MSSELVKTIMERSADEEKEMWRRYRVFKNLKRIAARSEQPHRLGVTSNGKFAVYLPNDKSAATHYKYDKAALAAAMRELPGRFRRGCTITDYLDRKQAELVAKRLAKEEEERKRLEQEREKEEKAPMEKQNKRKPTYKITKINYCSGARRFASLDSLKVDEIDMLPPTKNNHVNTGRQAKR